MHGQVVVKESVQVPIMFFFLIPSFLQLSDIFVQN